MKTASFRGLVMPDSTTLTRYGERWLEHGKRLRILEQSLECGRSK